MSKVDLSIELTDSVIDSLLDDWFDRDGETFLRIRKKGRIGWEKTLERGDSYSAYILEAPTLTDLIKRAYSLAYSTLLAMNLPFRVALKISSGSTSFSNGKIVCVSTAMFDDKKLSTGDKLDTFLGVTIHEGCHVLYTDFKILQDVKLEVIRTLFNIIEDERIEEICAYNMPGFANFLEKSKYYYFDLFYLDYVVPKKEEGRLTPFDRIMDCILHVIRYPKYLNEPEIVEFGHYLLAIKKVLVPYPVTTKNALQAAEEIFQIIEEFYTEEEKKDVKSESSEEDSDEDSITLSEKAIEKLLKDAGEMLSALEKASIGTTSASTPSSEGVIGLSSKDMAHDVVKDSELLGHLCEGIVEVGDTDDSYFTKVEDCKEIYDASLCRVKRYIPAIAKIMRGHCKEYKLIHRSMRSGILDTDKLAEAFQGVSTVYRREGEVKTDKISVCLLIDESGSMHGERIVSARDAAVLIHEALRNIPNVELFIYGHSGDMIHSGATEMFIYREKGYTPKFSLGNVRARVENRDGIAILETAKRVKKQTKNPVLMFILSDGAPSAYFYRGEEAMRHVKVCVEKVEKMGFYVIQVCINHSYDPSKMFKNYVVMENMNTFAIELGKAIKKATMTATKVSIV